MFVDHLKKNASRSGHVLEAFAGGGSGLIAQSRWVYAGRTRRSRTSGCSRRRRLATGSRPSRATTSALPTILGAEVAETRLISKAGALVAGRLAASTPRLRLTALLASIHRFSDRAPVIRVSSVSEGVWSGGVGGCARRVSRLRLGSGFEAYFGVPRVVAGGRRPESRSWGWGFAQASRGIARSCASAFVKLSAQGQRVGRCRIARRALWVMRPGSVR